MAILLDEQEAVDRTDVLAANCPSGYQRQRSRRPLRDGYARVARVSMPPHSILEIVSPTHSSTASNGIGRSLGVIKFALKVWSTTQRR